MKTENKLKPLAVFRAYQDLIKEYHEKYGDIASRVDKNYMYGQVAKRFLISPKYAGQLIRYVMTHRSEFVSYEVELDALQKDIHKVQEFNRECKTPVNKFV